MKKVFKWWQILALIFDVIAGIALIICVATDINDDVFLPLALCFVIASSALVWIMNIRNKRQNR